MHEKVRGRGLVGAVSNYKGGTGKTMSSVSLASALGLRGKKVLVIDNDPQSDATRSLFPDIILKNSMYDLLNLEEELSRRPEVEDCIYPSIQENVSILPNISETSGLEIPLSVLFPESNHTLRNAVYDYVVQHYDYIFIDCPPTLSIFVANALYCADFVMIPMMAGSSNSLEGIKGVLDLMDSIRKSGNPNLEFLKILINKLDRRKAAHKANMQYTLTRFGEENVFKTVIPTNSDFETMETMRGTTIFKYGKRSRGAQAFKYLAAEFLDFFKDKHPDTLETE
jgi:chromosome partitioning protein